MKCIIGCGYKYPCCGRDIYGAFIDGRLTTEQLETSVVRTKTGKVKSVEIVLKHLFPVLYLIMQY